MKKIILTSALLVVSVALMSGSAMALPLTTALQKELDLRTEGGTSSVDVYNDMLDDSNDSTWKITASGTSANVILFEIAGYANTNSFGIYDLANTSNRVEIFSGSDQNDGTPLLGANTSLSYWNGFYSVDGFATSTAFTSGALYGYYLNVAATGETYFSNSGLNSDSADHMLAYLGVGDQFSVYNDDDYATWGPNEYILAWEDLNILTGSDQDYTDFVVMVESVEPIPEPATMLLFGAGLAGLAGVSRRKK